MAEISFFPKYEQKENRVTNYTLLVLKQIYNESPNLFQEFVSNLIKNEKHNINVGVNFWQQKGFECEKGKSILDGVITQSAFTIFIETKLSDWYYCEQLERHLSNLVNLEGKKIFLALCNFDGQNSEIFEQFMKKYKDSKDVIFAYFDFGNFVDILENIKTTVKSEHILTLIDEFEEFLYSENLLPTWKYRLDVVNCARSKKDIMDSLLYMCPEAKGAYKHTRSKYFGIYENKTVNLIAEIKAVCTIDYNEEGKELINISWYDKDNYKEEEILKEAKQKAKYGWGKSLQMFLLNNLRENINFKKNSSGGMFGSKTYFNFDSNIKNIDDLAKTIKDKNWSEFQ